MEKQAASLTSDVLHAALEGLEARKRSIEEQLEQVRAMLGIRADGQKRRGRPPLAAVPSEDPSIPEQAPRKRRRLSAEARARIAAAQRKRWATKKQSKEPAKTASVKAAPVKATKKRKLSAAGRKRIIEATKKRWAEYNAKKAAS